PEPEPNPDPEPEVDFSELETLLEQVDALEESDYTEESWMDLMNSREVAKFLLDDDDATQDQVESSSSNKNFATSRLFIKMMMQLKIKLIVLKRVYNMLLITWLRKNKMRQKKMNWKQIRQMSNTLFKREVANTSLFFLDRR